MVNLESQSSSGSAIRVAASAKKVRPSASGFADLENIYIDYNSACPRYLMASQNAKFVEIDPLFAKVGLIHEDAHALVLGDTLKDRELVLKRDLGDGVEFSGRCDFVTVEGEVHETKASFSASFKRDVIQKGKVKSSHLAQIVSYLIHLQQTRGKIVTGYYEQALDGSFVKKAARDFTVDIREDGAILVDFEESGFTVGHQLAHTYKVVAALTKDKVSARPVAPSSFQNPCRYCPMNKVCDALDARQLGVEEFKEAGRQAIEAQAPMIAKPIRSKK